ncbi:hypothetical protein Bca52824_048609 [Brassica carinata]|uniref:Uncharacterized protein n=1 Tax=Brassica carinata TaxID=52824 RepID=A0A8X7UR18_BRACI|nr:hypothetical protein Bca52824_048609 [Brassica carinata]
MPTKQVQVCKRILQTMLAKSIPIKKDHPLHSTTTFSKPYEGMVIREHSGLTLEEVRDEVLLLRGSKSVGGGVCVVWVWVSLE